jgi:hypothetical protein
MPTELIEFWRQCDLAGPIFPHPKDRGVLLESANRRHVQAEPTDFKGFLQSEHFGNSEDIRLHLSLLPIPYCGNLDTADIVVLLLNPGLTVIDFYAETRVPAFRDRLKRSLAQDFEGTEFPFLWLDPEFCWHGGFRWWEQKLRAVIATIAEERFRGRYLDALRDLSRRLALIELVPYHSQSFGSARIFDQLPSVEAVRTYARGPLAGAASRDEKTVIVARQEGAWGIPPDTPNVIVRSVSENSASHWIAGSYRGCQHHGGDPRSVIGGINRGRDAIGDFSRSSGVCDEPSVIDTEWSCTDEAVFRVPVRNARWWPRAA